MYKKFDVRKYSKGGAYRDDDYIFDKNGNFTGKIEVRKGPHRLVIENDDKSRKHYIFADQKNDPKTINRFYKEGYRNIKAISKKQY